jgi:hypothetical protein
MSCFVLNSPAGRFDLTPDPDCGVVYVQNHRDAQLPPIGPSEIPSWCFEPETIWFYFGATGSEDKVSAGEKIKSVLQEQR